MKIKIEKPLINLSEITYIPHDILQSYNKAMFEQRENEHPLIKFKHEQLLLECVRNGDLALIQLQLDLKSPEEFYMGRMSIDTLNHAQYAFVAAITLITRSALQGGVDELEAYNLSDVYIQKLDEIIDIHDINRLLLIAIFDFTSRVSKVKLEKNQFSYHVNRCISYMKSHLHQPLTLTQLADACNLSSPYLSSLFKKETGQSFSAYFIKLKLEAARQMMTYTTESITSIANYLNFCTPSNFTQHFSKEYGVTPKVYRNRLENQP